MQILQQGQRAVYIISISQKVRPLFARRHFSTMHSISSPSLIEEETISYYSSSQYYPVRMQQTFHGRYVAAVKLGYGGNSTVWLCNDNQTGAFKTLKVGILRKGGEVSQELKVSKYLKDQNSAHIGKLCVRSVVDSFNIDVRNGHHPCVVYEPLGNSLLDRMELLPGKVVNTSTAKWIVTYLLHALDYLHSASVIHTDIKLDNVLFTLPEDRQSTLLQELVDAERNNPGPHKIVNNTVTIYTSRTLVQQDYMGFPILCDLGACVLSEEKHSGDVQPMPYRAPEVILGMAWNSSIDIWNIGVLTWELLCGEYLFGQHKAENVLAQIISYLGPPPAQFLDNCPLRLKYFDELGNWKGRPIARTSLKERLEGDANIDLFLDFIFSMIAWEPEKRKTASELCVHPWLHLLE